MRVTLKDQQLHLRRLSDPEYEEAEALAQGLGKSLLVCPTCDRYVDLIEVNPTTPTYRFRGEEFRCDCRAQIALYARYLLANIGEQYMRLDWEDFEGTEDAKLFVAKYLDNWANYRKHGWGLELGGPLGVGKTFAATHIGKSLIKFGQRVYFVPFVEMVSAFEKQDGEEIERRIRSTPFVILDEVLGARSERQEDFYHTRFEAIIRHRTNFNLPTIITTNLGQQALDRAYPRTYSLLAAKQSRIEMEGEDARRTKIALENMELIANGEVRPIT